MEKIMPTKYQSTKVWTEVYESEKLEQRFQPDVLDFMCKILQPAENSWARAKENLLDLIAKTGQRFTLHMETDIRMYMNNLQIQKTKNGDFRIIGPLISRSKKEKDRPELYVSNICRATYWNPDEDMKQLYPELKPGISVFVYRWPDNLAWKKLIVLNSDKEEL